MAIHPDYFISGIWKSGGKITHFFVHKNMEGGFKKGEVKSEKEVIKLFDQQMTFLTLVWSYEAGRWIDGVEVKLVTLNDEKTPRSFKDHTESDHLDKLINMRPVMTPTSKFFI
ncbi:MAG TPA: hypothetical protein VK718_06035 [Ferruginibacter sp.]|nr:hypothetical protein [Ferruginibacter sp.]